MPTWRMEGRLVSCVRYFWVGSAPRGYFESDSVDSMRFRPPVIVIRQTLSDKMRSSRKRPQQWKGLHEQRERKDNCPRALMKSGSGVNV